MQQEYGIIDGSEQAAAALHPLRTRLLEEFREPRSAAEAARRLDLPRQRVGHHVRLLRDQGLLEKVGERRTGSFVEQLLRTTARAWVISPRALGAVGEAPADLRDRFSSEYLTAAAARTVEDLGELRRLADRQGKRLATLTLETSVRFADAAAQAAFAEELANTLADLVARYHDDTTPGGRRFRFLVGGHPDLPRDETTPEQRNGEPDEDDDTPHH